MSMRMRVRHATTYTYSVPTAASYSEARLTPQTTADQYVRRSRLEISPTAWSQEYRDYWGATVTAFEVTDPHDELCVVATSVVDTADPVAPGESIGWDDLDPNTLDRYCEFVHQQEKVSPAESLVVELDAIRAEAATPAAYVGRVVELLRGRVQRLVAATHVSSTAEEAWETGRGVTHDLTHVAIGALRHASIPARFVAGYVHPDADPQVDESVESEPHAWLEWWDGRWVGLDVTHDEAPGERHIVVSRGRDFDDNPNLRGIYSTDGEVSITVAVGITRLA
jgi:transglutaminase-like putative cysteine protease